MNTIVYSTTSYSAKGLNGFYLSHYLLGKIGLLKNYIEQAVSLVNMKGCVIFCFIGSEFGKTAESIFPTKRYYFSSCLRENETSAEKYTMQGRNTFTTEARRNKIIKLIITMRYKHYRDARRTAKAV